MPPSTIGPEEKDSSCSRRTEASSSSTTAPKASTEMNCFPFSSIAATVTLLPFFAAIDATRRSSSARACETLPALTRCSPSSPESRPLPSGFTVIVIMRTHLSPHRAARTILSHFEGRTTAAHVRTSSSSLIVVLVQPVATCTHGFTQIDQNNEMSNPFVDARTKTVTYPVLYFPTRWNPLTPQS